MLIGISSRTVLELMLTHPDLFMRSGCGRIRSGRVRSFGVRAMSFEVRVRSIRVHVRSFGVHMRYGWGYERVKNLTF